MKLPPDDFLQPYRLAKDSLKLAHSYLCVPSYSGRKWDPREMAPYNYHMLFCNYIPLTLDVGNIGSGHIVYESDSGGG